MFIDSEGKYLFDWSYTASKLDPSAYDSYSFDLYLIEKAKANRYFAYIQFFNCRKDYIFGMKRGKIDLYEKVNKRLKLLKSLNY